MLPCWWYSVEPEHGYFLPSWSASQVGEMALTQTTTHTTGKLL